MEVYIEYAFLGNVFFDAVLLALAFRSAKEKYRVGKLLFSASVGGAFAVLYPLLSLTKTLGTVLKILVGALLVMLAFGRLKTKKEWGRYALTLFFFVLFTVSFGGVLLGVFTSFDLDGERFTAQRIPFFLVLLAFGMLSILSVYWIRRLYARRAVHQRVVSCELTAGGKAVTANGFLDSGNLAQKNGLFVCFVSPELVYELYGEDMLNGEDVAREEMAITTVSGKKTVVLYEGELRVKTNPPMEKKRVYFSPSANMIGREYTVLLYAGLLEEGKDYEMA